MIQYLAEEKDFDEIIKGNVLIDFFATWCGPCRMLQEELEALDEEGFTKEIAIVKIDVDKFPNLARRFGISSIPTMMHFVSGERKNATLGYMNKSQVKSFCEK